MIIKIAHKISSMFVAMGIVDASEIDIYVYGLDILISTLLTYAVVISISILLGYPIDALLYLACTAPLRLYGGGWHAKTHIQCTTLQCISFIIAIVISKYLPLYLHIRYLFIASVFCIAVILMKAPSEHPDNPLNDKARKWAKWKCLFSQIILLLFISLFYIKGFNQHSLLIMTGSLISTSSFLIKNKSGQ